MTGDGNGIPPEAEEEEGIFVSDGEASGSGGGSSPDPVSAPDDGQADTATEADSSDDPSKPARWRREVRAFIELFALNGFALVQPLLDIFGKAPSQFIYRGADRADILAFALIITFALPVALWATEVVVGFISGRARDVLHRVFLYVFAAILLVLVFDSFLPRKVAILAALAVAGLLVLAYIRTRGPRIWLAFASPAPIAFLVLFLLASQVAPLLRAPAGSLGATVGKRTPTVVVVFDEFPLGSLLNADGEIDADLYPNFARLAGSSTWFRQTTSVANYTALAVPAILTGNFPSGRTVATSIDHPKNLFTLVGGAMPIASSEVVTALCPSTVCEDISKPTDGLKRLLEDARTVMEQRLDPSESTTDPFEGLAEDVSEEPVSIEDRTDDESDGNRYGDFLDHLGDDGAGLSFIHLILPHIPHHLLPDGNSYPKPNGEPGRFFDAWGADVEPVEVGRVRHLLQVQWTDVLLGRLIDRLEENGTFDDTNIVVVADHGAGFEPEGFLRIVDAAASDHTESTAQVMWVPFFVKAAGQTTGEISDDPVRTVDVTPTIADLLDVDIPWDADGRSAFDGGSGDADEVTMAFADHSPAGIGVSKTVTIDRDEGWQILLDRNVEDFAPTDGAAGSDRLFRRGPRPDLWGEPMPDGSFPEIDFDVVDGAADDVDLSSGTVPALFRAKVDIAAGRPVAVVINDTVWATATTYPDGDRASVIAMIPTRAFVDGRNEISLHDLG